MIAPDSSVLIAGADADHALHPEASAELANVRKSGVLIAHTLAETTAVLTASAYGYASERVGEYLSRLMARRPVGVTPRDYPAALRELTERGIAGGALYDGLIALGARSAGATLVSLDRRGAATYEAAGVTVRWLGSSS